MATGYSRDIAGGSDSFRKSYSEGSDETFEYTCSPCKDKGLIVEAAFYCSVCDDCCCKSCQQVHNSLKGNKTHPVFGQDEICKWGQQARHLVLPTAVCPDHPDEALKFLCLNDNILCCSVCLSLDHRACTDMAYVPKMAKDIKQSQDIEIVGQNIDQLIQYADEIIKSVKKTQTTIDKSKQDYLTNIKDIQQQVSDFFNDLKMSASNEMDMFHNDKIKELQTLTKSLDDYKTKLAQLQTATQPSSTNNESQLFIEMFSAHQQLSGFQLELQKLVQPSQTTSFYLDKNPKLQEIFTTLKSLGELKEDKTTIQRKLPIIKPLPLLQLTQSSPSSTQASTVSAVVAPTTNVPLHQAVQLQHQQQQQLYKASNGRSINVQMSSDKEECRIKRLCQMPNGDILLTDARNNKVKRLNTKYKPTDYLDCPASPRAICCMGDTDAAVTCDNNTIYVLSITKRKMSVTSSIKLDHKCYGIAHNNGRHFVSDDDKTVYIYTTSGKHLKTVKTDNNGANIFSCTLHICSSPDGSKIYVADYDKGLVTLDSEGNHLSTYTSKDLSKACGVCVDRLGRVLMCGFSSHNVLQLDEGGTTRVGQVVGSEDGTIVHPTSVCIDNHNSTLIICHGLLENNYIKVFDLK